MISDGPCINGIMASANVTQSGFSGSSVPSPSAVPPRRTASASRACPSRTRRVSRNSMAVPRYARECRSRNNAASGARAYSPVCRANCTICTNYTEQYQIGLNRYWTVACRGRAKSSSRSSPGQIRGIRTQPAGESHRTDCRRYQRKSQVSPAPAASRPCELDATRNCRQRKRERQRLSRLRISVEAKHVRS